MPPLTKGYWVRQVTSALRAGVLESDKELWRANWDDLPEEARKLIKENVKREPKKGEK